MKHAALAGEKRLMNVAETHQFDECRRLDGQKDTHNKRMRRDQPKKDDRRFSGDRERKKDSGLIMVINHCQGLIR